MWHYPIALHCIVVDWKSCLRREVQRDPRQGSANSWRSPPLTLIQHSWNLKLIKSLNCCFPLSDRACQRRHHTCCQYCFFKHLEVKTPWWKFPADQTGFHIKGIRNFQCFISLVLLLKLIHMKVNLCRKPVFRKLFFLGCTQFCERRSLLLTLRYLINMLFLETKIALQVSSYI